MLCYVITVGLTVMFQNAHFPGCKECLQNLTTITMQQLYHSSSCITMQHRSLLYRHPKSACQCAHSHDAVLHRVARAAAAPNAAAAGPTITSAQFDALAELVAPCTTVRSDVTPLGRGLVARTDLQAGSQLLGVDVFNLLCVTDEPLRTGNAFGAAALADFQLLQPLPPLLANYLLSSRGDWFKRLVAWLLWLSRHGSGAWQLYTQMLPQEAEMASLMNFTPEERRHLQWPEYTALAEKERTAIQGLHDSVFSSRTGDLAGLDLAPTFDSTLWAACMVNSRCFSDNVGREALSLMVPCADMANHSQTPNAAYRLDPATQTFQLHLTQDLAAGSEVLISYLGSSPTKDNLGLMKDYGFVLPGNVNDTIAFANPGGQQPVLNAAELLAAAGESLPAGTGGAECPELAAAKRRQQAVLKAMKPFVQLGGSGASGQPDATKAKQQQLQGLIQQCGSMLSSCPTSLAEDEALLAGQAEAPLGPRMQAAVAARLERKRLIAAAKQMLQAYLARI